MLVLKNFSAGHQNALFQPVDLEILPGKLYAIAGRNGTGKSTLLYSLLKIIPVWQGDVLYNGKSINEYSQREWAQIMSAVFSRISQLPTVRSGEILTLGAENLQSELKEQIINKLKIEGLLSQSLSILSDGQLQRLLIARSLMQNTAIIAMDEPTAHLDYYARIEVFEILKDICADMGKTIIVISHEIDLIKKYADHVLLIEDKKLQSLSPSEFHF
ncbi:MAG: ATP-binding cassette domain-containing protein [Weeksellaceae bacterium]|nr:ATP-binding cassette domain-containing protein [Weeksellaceae bacterium]